MKRDDQSRWCPKCRTHWRYPVPADFSALVLNKGQKRTLAWSVDEFIEIARAHGDYSEEAFQALRDWFWWIQPSVREEA